MKNTQGYIALVSLMVVIALVLLIGVSTSLLAIGDLQSAYGSQKGEDTLGFVESCGEDALLRLNEDNAIPATVTLPEGVCSITINSQGGGAWDFSVSGSLELYTKRIRIQATRGASVVIDSWSEVP